MEYVDIKIIKDSIREVKHEIRGSSAKLSNFERIIYDIGDVQGLISSVHSLMLFQTGVISILLVLILWRVW